MSNFGSGGYQNELSNDDDEDGSQEVPVPPEPTQETQGEDRSKSQDGTVTSATPTNQSGSSKLTEEKSLTDVDLNNRPSTRELAKMLMADEFHEQNPRVPYATWRNGTSTGRGRITIELNEDISGLEMAAMREFKSRYDAEINKADLREFALAYGLMHVDDLFEIAEEWGLQYNN